MVPAYSLAVARVVGGRVLALGGVLAGVLLIALGAQLRVPVPGSDVPMTLQLLAVLLAALTLSPRRACAAVGAYLACGAAGLPVFAPGSTGLLGPTGGYLAGFLAGAFCASTIANSGPEQDRPGRLLLAAAVATIVVFTLGTLWRVALGSALGWSDGSVRLAVSTGVLPFALKAVLECCLAARLAARIRRRLGLGSGSSGLGKTEN